MLEKVNEVERSRQAAESARLSDKKLEEIERREHERNKRHDELLTTIETTASNFNQATEITQKTFHQCIETLY